MRALSSTPSLNPIRSVAAVRRPCLLLPPRPRRTAVQVLAAKKPPQQMLVIVPPHPLVKHWLAVARNAQTPPGMFRAALAELGRILLYEAVRDDMPTVDLEVYSPMGPAEATVIDPTRPIIVVPVLRAGLVLLEQSASVLPSTKTYHVGYVRNEETLEATSYLNKLPETMSPDDLVIITDPMIATGGTMLKVIEDIVSRGASPEKIKVVCVVCAPPALVKMSEKYPGLKVYSAMIDPEVNEKGYIIPGLGDAGDRSFGTA
eukprot:gene20665-27454_t